MKSIHLIGLSRIIISLCGIALITVLFVPLWQIELSAPQYPEGLILKMYPHKLAGSVDIINGLNHYIGMKTLHTEDFLEFTLLPYIISFFAGFCLTVAIFSYTYKWLWALFISFVAFGITAMCDFWRWEYQYGHELDPNAAINVPGMSYQPPLIGYKQLLNFGAYSIPDIGGWIFIGVGISLLAAIILHAKHQKVFDLMKGKAVLFLLLCSALIMVSCNNGPIPITIGVDACSYCKMGVVDKRFGAELITKKGKIYKFDDLHCFLEFQKEGSVKSRDVRDIFLVEFKEPHRFIELRRAFLLKGEGLRSPMGSNIAAFHTRGELEASAQSLKGGEVQLHSLISYDK